MKVLVTGATGFVGKVLVEQLLSEGHQVKILTRNIAKAAISLGNNCKYFQWGNTDELPPMEAFEGVEGVLNLMGETVAQKWDEKVKKQIYHSRIDGTRRLVEAIAEMKVRPKVFVSTSATGIYGARKNEDITENSSLGDDFLAKVCKDWENEANKVKNHGVRLVIIRVGVVLGPHGGALQKMLCPFKMGVGGKVGSGDQYMSWIQINDLASMYVEAMKNSAWSGVFNGTSPNPATNKEFTKQLGKTLHRPTIFPVPAIIMKVAFGEMSGIILEGHKVYPTKFKEKNFRFHYPTLEMALKESLR